MRLIDADALREELFDSSQFDTYSDYSMVLDTIDLAAKVDAEPVRHGKWECKSYDDDLYLCSSCGTEIKLEYGDMKIIDGRYVVVPHFPKYCEYCGARMDGGNNETD